MCTVNCNPLTFIFWGIMALITLPIALVCGVLYVIVLLFEVCCACGDIAAFLHQGLVLPAHCVGKMYT